MRPRRVILNARTRGTLPALVCRYADDEPLSLARVTGEATCMQDDNLPSRSQSDNRQFDGGNVVGLLILTMSFAQTPIVAPREASNQEVCNVTLTDRVMP